MAFHGVSVRLGDGGTVPISPVGQSVIGLIGTGLTADTVAFPVNTPVRLKGARQARTLGGTLGQAATAIYQQASPSIVVVRVEEGSDENETLGRVIVGAAGLQTAQASLGLQPRLFGAPGWTHQRPSDGLAEITISTAGGGYIDPPEVTIAPPIEGTTATATTTLTAGALTGIMITNPGRGYISAPVVTIGDAPSGGTTATGVAVLGSYRNPVVAALVSYAEKNGGTVVVDAGSTDASYTDVVTYAADWSSRHIYAVTPGVTYFNTTTSTNVSAPASGYVLGAIVGRDLRRGYWHSPSNQQINGITGVGRAIEIVTSNQPSAESNLLNLGQNVAVIGRIPGVGGFSLWGNHTMSSDARFRFLPTGRVFDVVRDSVQTQLLWATDRPFSGNLLRNIEDSVRSFLGTLKALGAVVGFSFEINRELTTSSEIQLGKLYFDFDFQPPPPVQTMTLTGRLNPAYFNNLLGAPQ